MFTRQQASVIRQEFWTTFGRYMGPVPSAEGTKINWVNYHTRVKDVHFKMEAGPRSAMIGIIVQHKDPAIQELYFEQFLELKEMLHATMEEEWTWQLHAQESDGKVVTKIFREISDVSVFNKEEWPELISFFKKRIVGLDSFWEDARYSFDALK